MQYSKLAFDQSQSVSVQRMISSSVDNRKELFCSFCSVFTLPTKRCSTYLFFSAVKLWFTL